MERNDLSKLPSVAKLLEADTLRSLPHHWAAQGARQALDEARASGNGLPSDEQLTTRAAELASVAAMYSYRPAINGSGTILNTGLGRARLAPAAIEAVGRAAGHVSLELDLETGRRGDRQAALAPMLSELTGAEDALVVNNNAAAVMLAVNTLALGKNVLLSRGQSVEIGGSFRMPDVVRSAGAMLIDVGTTNKTRLADYQAALDQNTGAILRCHPSNFVMDGFVEEASPQELTALAEQNGIALIDDVGSGCLVNTEAYGLPHETTLREALKAGAHVVTASGDKLLGGPQAGVILGKRNVVARIKKNPLARAVRIDKLTAAAMDATLRLYLEGRELEIPTLRYLSKPLDEVKLSAEALCASLAAHSIECLNEQSHCEPGGGSLPGVKLDSYRVGIKLGRPEDLSRKLRKSAVPIIGYIDGNVFWLDMRTLDNNELDTIVSAVTK